MTGMDLEWQDDTSRAEPDPPIAEGDLPDDVPNGDIAESEDEDAD